MKEIYDKYGEEGLKAGGGSGPGPDFSGYQSFNFAGFDPHSTFKSFFGEEDPFKGMNFYFIKN